MKNPSTRLVFNYWDTLRGERSAPERGEIEPGALRHALADTFVLENEPIGPVFRLAGTRLCALFGREQRGRAFAALWPDVEAQGEMRRLVQTVMDESAGAVAGLAAETIGGATVHLELLLLPLRYRGRTHARVLGALSPAVTPEWLGLDTLDSMRMISLRMIWPGTQAPRQIESTTAEKRPKLMLLPGGRA
ncbi:PAS domain-containing protein [Bosea sp. (in: a-proteobacteria)]|uniref:PAS domain-containing protein n=1 Tax=Bosea sp. (in: a-proteobacteria) TaxID=1871050 RepID=UPI002FCC1CE6